MLLFLSSLILTDQLPNVSYLPSSPSIAHHPLSNPVHLVRCSLPPRLSTVRRAAPTPAGSAARGRLPPPPPLPPPVVSHIPSRLAPPPGLAASERSESARRAGQSEAERELSPSQTRTSGDDSTVGLAELIKCAKGIVVKGLARPALFLTMSAYYVCIRVRQAAAALSLHDLARTVNHGASNG